MYSYAQDKYLMAKTTPTQMDDEDDHYTLMQVPP
jgi:hypothetical protein